MKPTPHIRPYWHVDAKWICGLIFGLLALASLVLFALMTLTSRDIAVPLATQVAAGMFSRNGLDDASELEEFKQKAAKQPGDKVETLPGVFITKADLATLPPRELRLKIFRQVVEPYYELGAKGVAAKQSADPAKQANIERQAGVLGLINQQTHDKLRQLFLISLALVVLPLAGLVYFSAGFGRLVSPGLVLVLLTWPAAIAFLVLQIAKNSSKPVGGEGGPVSPETLQLALGAVLPGLALVFLLGLILLLGAAVGRTVAKRKQPA
jgi:hypothetical protein